jgi:poly-gamma-glutamate capsule biosynthesis protein CapA/YwtB (metallophosphatase superfamily)
MLGRGVGARLADQPARELFGPDLLELLATADGTLLNLECCLSDRGQPWPDRAFHFRGPPSAVEALLLLGVRCVSLANNHALDFGPRALQDTVHHLRSAGIAVAGAGPDLQAARRPAVLDVGGHRLTVLALADHPAEYAAQPGRAGTAYADLRDGLPDWVTDAVRGAAGSPLLVFPHWGPNLTQEPLPYVRRAAAELLAAGATLVAGHSAHVFHGVQGRVLFDLGDLLDDYVVDPRLRNDLGVLWLLALDDDGGPVEVEAVPLRLTPGHTALARGEDARWVRDRLRSACAALGTEVTPRDGRLVVPL